jgi:hypothetical protein
MTDYSHMTKSSLDEMTTPELNQLIHDLSRESARSYQAGLLDELTKESEALGLYQSNTSEKPSKSL